MNGSNTLISVKYVPNTFQRFENRTSLSIDILSSRENFQCGITKRHVYVTRSLGEFISQFLHKRLIVFGKALVRVPQKVFGLGMEDVCYLPAAGVRSLFDYFELPYVCQIAFTSYDSRGVQTLL